MSGKTNKLRNANMDLLRIFSMLLIILLHSIDHSGVLERADSAPIMIDLWVRFTYMLSQVCVNCYVLISGYFLVKTRFRLRKLVILWLEVVFYSFVVRIFFILIGYRSFSISSLISCFVPIFTGRYWFITIYFGLYLLSPFLNIAINAMNRKQHTILNILLFVLFSFMVSIHPSFAGMNSGNGWGLAWFVVLYLAASWFRLYLSPKNKLLPFSIWILSSAVIALVFILVGNRISIVKTVFGNMYRYDSLAAYICSLCVLAIFLSINIKENWLHKVIIFIAPSTLGVYLIHAHADFSLWSWEFLKMPRYMNSLWFPIIQITVVICLFVFCAFIDLFRRFTIGKIEHLKVIETTCAFIEDRVNNLFNNMHVIQED